MSGSSSRKRIALAAVLGAFYPVDALKRIASP